MAEPQKMDTSNTKEANVYSDCPRLAARVKDLLSEIDQQFGRLTDLKGRANRLLSRLAAIDAQNKAEH
jgi:hypothetical protein